MNAATYKLPAMADWSAATLRDEAGIPKDATYDYMFLVDTTGKPIGHHVMSGRKATVIERMICIKGKSGSTDARLHQSVLDAPTNVSLIVIG